MKVNTIKNITIAKLKKKTTKITQFILNVRES